METNEVKFTKKSTTLPERQAIIQRWKQSGKSRKEFCIESGINYYTLMSWLAPKKKHRAKSLKRDQPEERFVEVNFPSQTTEALFARISFGKKAVDFFQPVSPDFLLRLVNA